VDVGAQRCGREALLPEARREFGDAAGGMLTDSLQNIDQVGQIPTKERKIQQGGLVFQHVNVRVGIGPKYLNRSCQIPSACAESYEPWLPIPTTVVGSHPALLQLTPKI
jgi:hypothetical protein